MKNSVRLVQSFESLHASPESTDFPGKLLPPGQRIESWHIVGRASDWEIAQERLLARLPAFQGIRLLAIEVADPQTFTGVRRLAAFCADGRIRLRFDHVIRDPAREDAGGSMAAESIRNLCAKVNAERIGPMTPAVMVVLPLKPKTVGEILPLWVWLEDEQISYQITVGDLNGASERQRYMITETLENAASRASLTERGQFYCAEARDALVAGEVLEQANGIVIAGEGREAHEAVRHGEVALPLPDPPFRWRLRRLLRRWKLDNWSILLRGVTNLSLSLVDGSRASHPRRSDGRTGQALVIGWYGTETVGDKAILGGILREMFAKRPELKVTVASTLPFYTRQTMNELGHTTSSEVVPYDFGRIARLMPELDEVLIGGGPLMDLVEMFDLVRVMHLARKAGVATVIAGCGVGPAHWFVTRWAVRALLELADIVVLRDRDSKDLLDSWHMDSQKVEVGLDPAINYVARLALPLRVKEGRGPVLGVAVRDWPRKFGRSLDQAAFEARRSELARLWASVCDGFLRQHGGQVKLVPMHTLHIGDDDRWFQARVRALAAEKDSIRQLTGSYSAEDIAEEIRDCDVFLGMRYHSILFAAALGVPTVAVDYSRGGKVAAFGRRVLPPESVFDVATLEASQIIGALGRALGMRRDSEKQRRHSREELVSKARLAGEAAALLL